MHFVLLCGMLVVPSISRAVSSIRVLACGTGERPCEPLWVHVVVAHLCVDLMILHSFPIYML